MANGFKIILSDNSVKAIHINIFGGLCDGGVRTLRDKTTANVSFNKKLLNE
ncbi:MAG: hypothetical protein H3C35_13690 [Bacteroidetes bacterium]|nr:hypothetical protein [Bacteroidota bacterium]